MMAELVMALGVGEYDVGCYNEVLLDVVQWSDIFDVKGSLGGLFLGVWAWVRFAFGANDDWTCGANTSKECRCFGVFRRVGA